MIECRIESKLFFTRSLDAQRIYCVAQRLWRNEYEGVAWQIPGRVAVRGPETNASRARRANEPRCAERLVQVARLRSAEGIGAGPAQPPIDGDTLPPQQRLTRPETL